jgi:hypothetical protein
LGATAPLEPHPLIFRRWAKLTCTRRTTSVGGDNVTACFTLSYPIHLKYTDPDGRIERKADGSIIFYAEPKLRIVEGNSKNIIVVQYGYILANDGTKINARVNHSADVRSEDFDCHGLTFADGIVWINDSEIETLLSADGYIKTDTSSSGDVMIQKNVQDIIIHSATVIEVDNENKEVKVREAVGVLEFRTPDGKLTRVREQDYKIDASQINGSLEFYIKPEDKIIE